MAFDVECTDDPAAALAGAARFLLSRPVEHNVVLTLLGLRAHHPEPGRYWTVRDGGDGGAVAGFVFQSPTTYPAFVTPMPPAAVVAAVAAVGDVVVDLPGVRGEAATAARFAGGWTERHAVGAVPVIGQRLYEVTDVVLPTGVVGRFRPARPTDRDLLIAWHRGFGEAVGDQPVDDAAVVDRRLAGGELAVWEDGGEPVSMAGATEPVAGVARIGAVFTPAERRRRGYAAACVAALSSQVLATGSRCILYTQLGDATANAMYRRIGYRALEESLHYRFA